MHRTKWAKAHKAPGQVLMYCLAIHRSIYIAFATSNILKKNCVHVCSQACYVVIHMTEADVQC